MTIPLPDSLPVLRRGRHRRPDQGACFMEYTALLAGEPFSDRPACVDADLAAVLRGANDDLPDEERQRLLPLLGRSIGLAVVPPPGAPGRRAPRRARHEHRRAVGRYRAQVAALRRSVAERFLGALGSSPAEAERRWPGCGHEVPWLFWSGLIRPTPPTSAEERADRVVERLVLLHECYEQAMHDLGLPPAISSAAGEDAPAAPDDAHGPDGPEGVATGGGLVVPPREEVRTP